MATRKTKSVPQVNLKNLTNPLKKLNWRGIKTTLAIIFYLQWIIIGLFFLLLIYGQIRQGVIQSILSQPADTNQTVQDSQIPTETSLPGVGLVNIECVQNTLSDETIQKILTDGTTNTLTEEERTSLQPCIVEPEAAPTPTP